MYKYCAQRIVAISESINRLSSQDLVTPLAYRWNQWRYNQI